MVRDVHVDAVERQRSVRREHRALDLRFRFALAGAVDDVALEAFALVFAFATTVGRADVAIAAFVAGGRADGIAEAVFGAVITGRARVGRAGFRIARRLTRCRCWHRVVAN